MAKQLFNICNYFKSQSSKMSFRRQASIVIVYNKNLWALAENIPSAQKKSSERLEDYLQALADFCRYAKNKYCYNKYCDKKASVFHKKNRGLIHF